MKRFIIILIINTISKKEIEENIEFIECSYEKNVFWIKFPNLKKEIRIQEYFKRKNIEIQ